MKAVRHIVYLHGFASSPASSKAQRFGSELARLGVGFTCPDLNEPAFETLTVSRMLEQTREAVAGAAGRPVALVGSSLGAFVALHAAVADAGQSVDRLILLAPAFDFGGGRLRRFGEYDVDEWRRRGSVPVMHHALGAEREIGFALCEDAAQYDAFGVELAMPVLVFQGRADTVVDPVMVTGWGAGRPGVDLRLLDDDHQLASSIDDIWRASERFLLAGAG